MPKIKRFWMIVLSVSMGFLLVPLAVWGANLLKNDGLEAPFVQYGTYRDTWKLQVAHDWNKFVIDSYENEKRLRYFSSCEWAAFNGGPVCEKRDGSEAQVWWSSEKFDSGVYQQISRLAVGEHYGFEAGILQVWETTRSQTDGKMFRSVGIDPYGGTDAKSPHVIWGPEEDQDVDWFYPGVGATAMSSTVTVFARVRSPYEASTPNSNQVWVDDTFFDLAPTTTLTLQADLPTRIIARWNGAPRAGFHLFAYEAQYKKATDLAWPNLQYFDSRTEETDLPTGTSASFAVEPGEDYLVRARMWHEVDGPGNAHAGHEVPGPWAEESISTGGVVKGKILTNQGQGLGNATVTAAETATATTSIGGGSYSLFTGPGEFSLTATISSGWTSPVPVAVTVPLTGAARLTLTLRPPDNAILSGDFENSLDGWQTTLSDPQYLTANRRSGDYSLCLTETAELTYTTQVNAMYAPVLSFWYRVDGADGSRLTAQIFGPASLAPTTPLTFTAATNGWQFAWLPLNLRNAPGGTGYFISPTNVYSGEVGVRFSVTQAGAPGTRFCLDEVSLGRSWGGPNKVLLPLISKN